MPGLENSLFSLSFLYIKTAEAGRTDHNALCTVKATFVGAGVDSRVSSSDNMCTCLLPIRFVEGSPLALANGGHCLLF